MADQQKRGRIIRQISGYFDVEKDGDVYRTRGRGNLRRKSERPIVGDWVDFTIGQDESDGTLDAILPRTNGLIRPPVANVDQAILVTAAAQPDFSANLLDRFLVYLEGQGIHATIYLTKTDLLDKNELEKVLETMAGYEKIGYRFFHSEPPFAEPVMDAVRKTFADKLTIFTGQTGAGKSTLINHLEPDLDLATGEISAALNRGKHTTRTTELFLSDGGLIADTPGFSSLELLGVDVSELRDRFPEFVELANDCKFRTCQHLKEPKCAVRAALEAGEIMQSRYDNYVLFHTELSNQRPVYKK